MINKIDRKDARVADVIRDTENLFLTVVADDDLLDFPIIYAFGRDGKTFDKMPENMEEKAIPLPSLKLS